MKLSDHAKSLVDKLRRESPPSQRQFGEPGWNIEVLEQLVERGEFAAIPYLIPMLFSDNRDESLSGARAVEALLSRATPEGLAWLDELIRQSLLFGYHVHWQKLQPLDLAKWVGPGEQGRLLLRLSSFHSNGYIREESVRRLTLIEDGSELPYLLIRLGDWVIQVREAAKWAVLQRIRKSYADHFVKNLALVLRLKGKRRADHTHIIELVTRLLSGPSARPSVFAGINDRSRTVRRACFQLLTTGRPADLSNTLLMATEVEDPVIRLRAAGLLGDVLPADQLSAALLKLLRDRFPPIRREALSLWVKAFPANAGEKLMLALLDGCRSVREEARYHLRKNDDSDFAQFYRDALVGGDSKVLGATISGLAESGIPEDAELVLPFLFHPMAKIRRAACRCLMVLGGAKFVHRIFQMVLDDSPGVSAQARKALEPHTGSLTATKIWNTFKATAKPVHARLNLLRLIAALPKWEKISYLILAASDEDRAVAEMAGDHVLRWNYGYNRSQSVPSKEQIERLDVALSHASGVISDEGLGAIRFAVSPFRKQ